MGPKKPKAVRRSKKPPLVAPSKSATSAITDAVGAAPNPEGLHPNPIGKSQETDSKSYAAIKLQFEEALTNLRLGNLSGALKKMKDLFASNKTSPQLAFVHRVRGTLWQEAALVIDCADTKHQYLRNAIESARDAVKLSPNSIEFFHFYANLLLEAAKDPTNFAEVTAVCQTALAIKNPVDPATESLQDESPEMLSTPEKRVSDMHLQLKSLIEKAKSADVSYKIQQLRGLRPQHDRLKSHHPEAAAQFEQQKSASQVAEKRKSRKIKKTGSSDKKRELVKSYWKLMTVGEKKDLMRIRVSDLKKHCSSLMNRSLSEMLDEALEYGEKNGVWKFWSSSRNAEKFCDRGRFVDNESAGVIEMEPFMPEVLDEGFADKLLNELNVAVAMSDEQSKVGADDVGQKDSGGDPNEKWPTSDYPLRAQLLRRIHDQFQELMRKKCLVRSHVRKVMHLALKQLQAPACQSDLTIVEETPFLICCLDVPELKEILLFFMRISRSCKEVENSDNPYENVLTRGLEIDEKIIFGHDDSYLMVDESSLPYNLSRVPSFEFDMELDSDGLLSWILEGGFDSDLFKSCEDANTTRSELVKEKQDSISDISRRLRELIEEKRNHTSCEKALEDVEALCSEERKEREHAGDYDRRNYASILRKRRDEPIADESETAITTNKHVLDAIANVLKAAESINENLGDSCIELAIQRQKEQVSLEISEVDAKLTQLAAEMRKLLDFLALACCQDYRSIVIPIAKSFIREYLENVAEKHATDISNAAQESLLAESTLKHATDGKKSKATRKDKGPKADPRDELHVRTAEEISSPIAHVEERSGSESAVTRTDDATRLQEKEHNQEVGLEVTVQKLEEDLEYQKQIEDKAKQKHIAKLKAESNSSDESSASEQECPENLMEEDATEEYDAGVGSDDSKHGKRRYKHTRKTKAKKRRNKGRKAATHDELHDQTANEIPLSMSHVEGSLGPEDSIHSTDDATTLEGEEGKSEETVEYQRQIDHEAQKKHLHKESLSEKDRGINASEDEPKKSTRDLHTGSEGIPQDGGSSGDSTRPLSNKNSQVDGGDRGETNGDDADAGKCETCLRNEVGGSNCFLNAIVQSLWSIRRFRKEFMWRSAASRLIYRDSPVACALYEMFKDLKVASKDSKHKQEAVTPTLRAAWDNLCPRRNFRHELSTNDACEALCFILRSLDGLTNVVEGVESSIGGICCTRPSCVAYSVFGMEILEKISCKGCSKELQQLKYTSFFFPEAVGASALREEKNSHPDQSFEFYLQKLNQLPPSCPCPCRAQNLAVNNTLSPSPHVFTAAMRWLNAVENAEDIKATLEALSSEVHLSKFYNGVDQEAMHRLVCVVCRKLHHYKCFAYSHHDDWQQWITFDDDQIVKEIGTWDDVIDVCVRELLQPQYLMFESVNLKNRQVPVNPPPPRPDNLTNDVTHPQPNNQ